MVAVPFALASCDLSIIDLHIPVSGLRTQKKKLPSGSPLKLKTPHYTFQDFQKDVNCEVQNPNDYVFRWCQILLQFKRSSLLLFLDFYLLCFLFHFVISDD